MTLAPGTRLLAGDFWAISFFPKDRNVAGKVNATLSSNNQCSATWR
jgi:hypothetical protein